MSSARDFMSLFQDPTIAYRAKPFWAWNGKLDEAELRRQIRIFKEMGMGGFFMHSRVGLVTPYLSQEWFDLTRSCIDEAQKTGMEAWLYDEDRWPSGAAGGLVTKDPAYRMRQLAMTRHSPDGYSWPGTDKPTYVFGAVFEDNVLTWYKKLEQKEDINILPRNAEILQFVVDTYAPSSWYNDQTYLDTMNPDAVAKFIEVTHEAYRREVGEHFAKTVPGMFTDEPNMHGIFEARDAAPWTDRLPQRFDEMFHYDVTAKLPELWFDVQGQVACQVRHHYGICRTRLFVDAFAKQVGDWCTKHNITFTGHVLYEDPIQNAATFVGSTMPFYPYMQAPGVDILTQFCLEYTTVKQVSSVARQMGRKWVLSELYGCTGWPTTFEAYKHSGDWQAVLGITLRCPHLSWYTMAGEAKRDYPASIHFHSPWHRRFKSLEDYFSRINVLMTEGTPVCDVAVVHTIESYHLALTPPKMFLSSVFNEPWANALKNVTNWLLGSHIDFDYLDEQVMVDFAASVGKDDKGAFLKMGQMAYRAVVVPMMKTIRKTTLDVLNAFIQAGGKVVFVGDVAPLMDALPSDAPAQAANGRTVANDAEALAQALSATRTVSVRGTDGKEITDLFYQLRHIGDDWALFLVNTNRERSFDMQVRLNIDLPKGGQVQVWDAVTGQRFKLAGELTYKSAAFKLDVPASGSRLIVVTSSPEELPVWNALTKVNPVATLNPAAWSFLADDTNALVLDRCDCKTLTTGKLKFSRSQCEIIELDRQLRDLLGLRYRGGDMVQPWVSADDPIGATVPIRLTYKFNVKAIPTTACLLAIEQPERWTITMNDQAVSNAMTTGWWVDPAIKTLQLDPTLFHRGKNTIVLEGQFDRLTDLEAMFLLGQFGVETDGKTHAIVRYPTKLELGSWRNQGLPFYTGNITYRTTFDLTPAEGKRYQLRMGKFDGVAIEVAVNGKGHVVSASPDYVVDITDGLAAGKNTIDITLLGSRRNAFGPLHQIKPTQWTGPGEYLHNPDNWQDPISLLDYGMTEAPTIVELS